MNEHLWWGWEAGTKPMLEAYVTEFGSEFEPFSSLASLPVDLVVDEFAARHAFAATSDRPAFDEYERRFDGWLDLRDRLASRLMDGGRMFSRDFLAKAARGRSGKPTIRT